MKHHSSKERTRDRNEFVYRHRNTITELEHKSNLEQKQWVDLFARSELGYSCKTISVDIWSSLSKTLKQITEPMKVRNLIVSDSMNLNGCREFNHLRIENLDEFLEDYQNNLEYYKSPFEIIANLESQIKFKNYPSTTILVPYKEMGDVIFDLAGISLQGKLRIVTYRFSTFIS